MIWTTIEVEARLMPSRNASLGRPDLISSRQMRTVDGRSRYREPSQVMVEKNVSMGSQRCREGERYSRLTIDCGKCQNKTWLPRGPAGAMKDYDNS